MPFWPFKRREPEHLSVSDLRDRLIGAAASGSRKQLVALCKQYKAEVAANVDFFCTAPENIRTDPAAIDHHVQCLGAVASCLANECGAPELWHKLCGTPESNPLLRWTAWCEELPQRLERLEHAELITEVREFIPGAKSLEGNGARQYEAFLQGRLGDLLFNTGQIAESIESWQRALNLCQEINDVEGQRVYLSNLLEAHRYLGHRDEAIRFGEEALTLAKAHNLECEGLEKQLCRMRLGEPSCRVVLVREGKEFELDEFSPEADGHYTFLFRRNRMSLQMAELLVRRGNELASSGQLADAMEKYREAMEVDPYDPDPVYQYGMCLMEMGAYGKARESFEEVERLAAGWFQTRFCRWLADSLDKGDVSDDEFRILRLLEDGGLPATEALPIATQAVKKYPHFAPFYLSFGNLLQRQDKSELAIESYRKGLELVAEPDLECRLLCALAGILPVKSSERQELVKRATHLDGNLVAKAMAIFIPIEVT